MNLQKFFTVDQNFSPLYVTVDNELRSSRFGVITYYIEENTDLVKVINTIKICGKEYNADYTEVETILKHTDPKALAPIAFYIGILFLEKNYVILLNKKLNEYGIQLL